MIRDEEGWGWVTVCAAAVEVVLLLAALVGIVALVATPMSKLSLSLSAERASNRPVGLPAGSEEGDPRSLVVLAQGARMLAEARTLDDFRQVRVLALAAQHYARKWASPCVCG